MKADVKNLAKKYRHFNETDEQVETYVDNHYDSFYVYFIDGKVRGYCDYYIVGRTLHVYDLVCEGNLFDFWKYALKVMHENNISKIKFKRKGKERIYERPKR